ncbi:DNA alkylation repair protein [Bdellovibrio sp. HCB337]|uniref:DNA alkylation repair protein n=1 Tax=Bdellovibrio sp. HCB337 TaxID=3394358 RepID=UPI0039A5A017
MKKEENPNAFKFWINKDLLQRMAESLKSADPKFDHKTFVALAPKLDPLELKPRVQLVRDQLRAQLPQDFKQAVNTLLKSLKPGKIKGFDLWPYTEFVQTYGLDHPELSLKALFELTQLFTSEFAVRPFIKKHPEQTMAFLLKCSTDKNVHVRRWASEGSRPRLPWGERLDTFVKNPKPALPILENLKHDEELYVRKSVANHLNDIAKDNPEVLLSLLKKWQKSAGKAHQEKVEWITHRALRTLIKDGNPKALELIGADHKVKVKVSGLKLQKQAFKMNEKIEFEFKLQSQAKKPQKLIVDYVVHHVKANKETAPKVFKLKSVTMKPGETISIHKRHHLKPITTRKYYSGVHIIEIQVNGRIYAASKWNLQV